MSAAAYNDEDVFARERECILDKIWRLACHESELPEKYDFRTFDHVGQPLLMIRGGDRKIRSFVNVCSHRGAKLVNAMSGNARQIQCFYHHWTYDSAGNCIGIPRALRNIVRRDNGEGYREMLERLARESGVETPTAEDLARLEHKRKGKKLSNTDWVSKSDPEAKIAKMKDGTTHLAYKPEHAVDLDTGAVVAAELHPGDEGDTTTLSKTLAKAEANLGAVDAAPTSEDPAECVADKGYHSRAVLRALNDSPWKTRIAAPKQTGFSRWHGDEAARRAVTNNRARLKSGVAREAFKLRAEIVERCFAHNLDRGGMRRTWLRGRENVHKRYLLHVAGHNLSLLMRQLIGAGTPREAVAGGYGGIFVLLRPTGAMMVARGGSQSGQTAFAAAFLIWG